MADIQKSVCLSVFRVCNKIKVTGGIFVALRHYYVLVTSYIIARPFRASHTAQAANDTLRMRQLCKCGVGLTPHGGVG